MKKLLVTMPVLTLLVACAASTSPGPRYVDDGHLKALADQYNANAATDEQKVVCSNKPLVGSRLPKTICRTQAQVALEEREGERMIEKPRPKPTQE
jgi:hypothetical protein